MGRFKMVNQKNNYPIDRNIAIELVRVTEAAAMNAVQHMGMGDKELVDQAAVDSMRTTLNSLNIDGTVVIGEGEKDEAPMLYIGEKIGTGNGPKVDIAVDPIDGTTLLSKGLPGAIAVIALTNGGAMSVPEQVFYMNKIAVGPEAKDVIDIEAPLKDNLKKIAKRLSKKIDDLQIIVLDRPRHDNLLYEIRSIGAKVKLISDGDVAAGILAALPDTDIDVLMGIGGTPEGVITAAAILCLGGAIQGKAWPRDQEEKEAAISHGLDIEKIYSTEDLVGTKDVFFAATGASNGDLLKGVRFSPDYATTQSLVIRSRSNTIRWIDAKHDLTKLNKLTISK